MAQINQKKVDDLEKCNKILNRFSPKFFIYLVVILSGLHDCRFVQWVISKTNKLPFNYPSVRDDDVKI